MEKLTHSEVINLMLQLAVMLAAGRFLAEVSRKLKQPAVVGEIMAGILLGPTLLGSVFPETFQVLFPITGASAQVLDGFIQVAVVLLLFIAGLEVDLQIVWQQGKQALYTSFFALVIPFIIGFAVTYAFPSFFLLDNESNRIVFSLFIGTTIAITALPVIARILMDLDVFKSNMGMLIIASAMIIDLLGWLIFSVILSLMGGPGQEKMGLGQTIGLTVGFTIGMLTLGKWLINRSLPWINSRLAWPGGLLSLSLALCFVAAAFTEFIGIHAIFGAFIIGVALGDSEHLTERAKEIVHHFINNIFAPLFFVSLGLHVNFVESFNLPLILVFLVLAFIGKVSGAFTGARIGGLGKHQSWAVGFGMNTHGALEVILGAIALNAGLISEEIFVAILVMVVVTIIVSGPLMRYSLRQIDNEQLKKASETVSVIPEPEIKNT
ncbi:cation:proton antiporter [Roseivirga sp. BDSF3-8]|uniref:cation:proton antiporter n=1 Tax=Roseivirga sp. BDSF3-8 TaxID=3241598 RepID=UPI00353241D9